MKKEIGVKSIDMQETEDIFVTFISQRVDVLLTLMQCGFFDMKGGSMTIHFRPNGRIGRVEKHDVYLFS